MAGSSWSGVRAQDFNWPDQYSQPMSDMQMEQERQLILDELARTKMKTIQERNDLLDTQTSGKSAKPPKEWRAIAQNPWSSFRNG